MNEGTIITTAILSVATLALAYVVVRDIIRSYRGR